MTDQSTTDPFNLQRFLDAQAGIGFTPYETALAEMRAGHKQSHWIWYVFPQIQLGTSALSEHFAIKSHEEVLIQFPLVTDLHASKRLGQE